MRWGQTRYFFRCRNNFLPRFLGLLTLGSPSLTCTPDLKPVNMEVGALVLARSTDFWEQFSAKT